VEPEPIWGVDVWRRWVTDKEAPLSAVYEAHVLDMAEEAEAEADSFQILVEDDDTGKDAWMVIVPAAKGFMFLSRPIKGLRTIPPDADVSSAVDFEDAEKFVVEE